MEKNKGLEIPQIKKTQFYYDAISKGYSELYHSEQIKKISLVSSHLPNLQSPILDLGSGDGVLNNFLDKKQNLISLDLSFKMLKNNSNKNKLQASITNIPIKTNSIDNIISFTAIQDVENTKKVISEINRILKNKGILILSFLKKSSKKENIISELNKYFKIEEKIEEEKDLILVCRK